MSIVEIVERVADYFKLDKSIITQVSSETLNQAAKRPPITGFDLTKSREVLGYNPRSFEEGIAVLMEQMK
jgi:dTDP-4-dehydrorhamnose reductase